MEYQKFNSEVLEASRRISEMRSNHSSYTSRKWPLYPLWGAPMHTYTIPSSMQCFFFALFLWWWKREAWQPCFAGCIQWQAVDRAPYLGKQSVSGPFGFLDVNFWSLKRANGNGIFLHSFPFSVVKSWSFYLPLSGRHPRRDELASLRW